MILKTYANNDFIKKNLKNRTWSIIEGGSQEAMWASPVGHCKPMLIVSYLHRMIHTDPVWTFCCDMQLCWWLTGRFGSPKSRFFFIFPFKEESLKWSFSSWWKRLSGHESESKGWNCVAKSLNMSSNDVQKSLQNFFQMFEKSKKPEKSVFFLFFCVDSTDVH